MRRYLSIFSQANVTLIPNIWDILALVIVLSLMLAMGWAASHMALPFHVGQEIPITLNISSLPNYALQTTIRMFIALFFSFIFSLIVATVAAKSERAGKLIIPLIDILQSVPILAFLAISVTGFIALFPNSMLGPECAAIFVVFTSQVWNMTLSFYQSLRTVPKELVEAGHMYQLSSWQRFWRIEAPFGMPGLLWNAMMSMSGGWFFIVAAEAISVAHQNITLPGIGSYIALAIDQRNMHAIIYSIITMMIVIALYDQLLFRPLVSWSEKFKCGDISEDTSQSWVLDLLKRTRFLHMVGLSLQRLFEAFVNFPLFSKRKYHGKHHAMAKAPPCIVENVLWYAVLMTMVIGMALFAWHFIFQNIPLSETWQVFVLGAYTALRVFVLIMICSLIWLPVGLWVGTRPRVTQYVQPIAQFLAAFPANLFFPIFVILIVKYNLNVEIWTAPLMVLGTQWYILFNVIAGASAIPRELTLAAENMQLKGWIKWKRFLLPAVFPYYVTGAITAAGGSWNASIVAEVIHWGHITLQAHGLGAYIAANTESGNFTHLALGVVVMCIWVTAINLLFWRRLYNYAEQRYNLN
ncbi:MAG: ABC transporter permease subunit [Gammaproteobacteria bacterium]|nr:ABC transporter permease subunit [Gammaproteobacteria bacterium]